MSPWWLISSRLVNSNTKRNISYGFKVALTLQDAWLPKSIVLVQGFTPTSGPDTATQYIVTYGWGWELPNCWKIDAAMCYSEDSEAGDRFNLWAPSVVLAFPLAKTRRIRHGIFQRDVWPTGGKIFLSNLFRPACIAC